MYSGSKMNIGLLKAYMCIKIWINIKYFCRRHFTSAYILYEMAESEDIIWDRLNMETDFFTIWWIKIISYKKSENSADKTNKYRKHL